MKIAAGPNPYFLIIAFLFVLAGPRTAYSEPDCHFVKSTHCQKSSDPKIPWTCSFQFECTDTYGAGDPFSCAVSDHWLVTDLFVEGTKCRGGEAICGKHQINMIGELKSADSEKIVRYSMNGSAYSKGVSEFIDSDGRLHFIATFIFTGKQFMSLGQPGTGNFWLDAGLSSFTIEDVFDPDPDNPGNWIFNEDLSSFEPGILAGHYSFLSGQNLIALTSEILCQ